MMVMNCVNVTPGNILKLKRKKPKRHNENKNRISRILYAKTLKIFLVNNQFFIYRNLINYFPGNPDNNIIFKTTKSNARFGSLLIPLNLALFE
jgi:hypothetical protein